MSLLMRGNASHSPGPIDRLRQTRRLLRTEGYTGVATRLVDRVSARLAPAGTRQLPIARADLVRASAIADGGWVLPPALETSPGEPLTIAWVSSPPSPGSGGHTTMFRLVSALERAGHRCIVYLADENGWDHAQHVRATRSWWPWVEADIRDAADGLEDAHAIFATAWETAYTVLASPARGARFYLVQDFEPSFYPAGSLSLLAEATYRFGFHAITAGRWLAELLQREYGMVADPFDFGRDPVYTLDPAIGDHERDGICFYSRPGTPRRAYELAVLALELFAERHPEVPIHLYGFESTKVPFAATHHGLLTPAQLNDLYNRCIAGLVLSATNVSLVPHEMLAAGCIPLVNDAEHNRIVLDNAHVAYAPATPFEIAHALGALVGRPAQERAAAASAAAASVDDLTWDEALGSVVRVVEDAVYDAASRAVASSRG